MKTVWIVQDYNSMQVQVFKNMVGVMNYCKSEFPNGTVQGGWIYKRFAKLTNGMPDMDDTYASYWKAEVRS